MGGLEITNDVTRNSKALRGNALGGAWITAPETATRHWATIWAAETDNCRAR